MDDKILTPQGKKKLEGELEGLKRKQLQVVVKIKDAKELGDLSENAEYHAAKEEQGFIEAQIAETETLLKSAIVVKPTTSKTKVSIGSKIKVKSDGETTQYELVGMNEADPSAGKISAASPLGRALLGAKKGDTVEVGTPAGIRTFEVFEIS